MFKILYLVLNGFTNDARVLRAAQTSVEMGCRPTVLALHEPGLSKKEQNGEIHVERFGLARRGLSRGILRQLNRFMAMVGMVWGGLFLRPTVVHANDLPTLPIGYLIARLTGARLIYDAHELYSDRSRNTLLPRWSVKTGLILERLLAKKADFVSTVSEGISEAMTLDLDIPPPRVIRNFPYRQPSGAELKKNRGPLREKVGISMQVPVILYQGLMGKGRGLFTLVTAMRQLTHSSAVLVLLGDGVLISELKSKVNTWQLENRVYFHSAVSPDVLHNWTQDADLGVHPIEGNCANHRLCLPNKLFEYIQAGLPVLVTDLPEMRKIVSQYGVGEVFRDGDANHLATRIDGMLLNGRKYRLAARTAANVLSWDVEKDRLIDIYKSVLKP